MAGGEVESGARRRRPEVSFGEYVSEQKRFEDLSAPRIAAAFDTLKDIGKISSKGCLGNLLRI